MALSQAINHWSKHKPNGGDRKQASGSKRHNPRMAWPSLVGKQVKEEKYNNSHK
jgi:hypothetical protein